MRLMACFGVVVLLVILDSLSKALASAEETKRNTWLQDAAKHYGQQGFNREIRWNSPRPLARLPRNYAFDANVENRFLHQMERRAWVPKAIPDRSNAAYSDDNQQRLINAVIDMLDARSAYTDKEE